MTKQKFDAVKLKAYIEDYCREICEWYGSYYGRGMFIGIGLYFEHPSLVFDLGRRLATSEDFEDLPSFHHSDNLGLGSIYAWRESIFTPESMEAIHDDDRYGTD